MSFVPASAPAVVSRNPGTYDVFMKGTDTALWHTSLPNVNWTSLGGLLYSGTGPAAVSITSSRMDAFVVGTDKALWHKSWSPGTSEIPQGLAWGGVHYYYMTLTQIFKCDANMNVLEVNTHAASDVGCNHFGDGAVYNGHLYCIAASSENIGYSVFGIWNTSDLSLVSYHTFPNSWPVAGGTVNYDTNQLVNMGMINAGRLDVFDMSLNLVAQYQASTPIWYTEGMDYYNGHYYSASKANYDANVNDPTGGIFMMNTDGSNAQRIIPYSAFTKGGELEGVDVKKDYIRVMCGGYVYLFTNTPPYKLAKILPGASAGWSGWASLGGGIYPGTSPTAAGTPTTIDVFVVGTDKALWKKSWKLNTGWGGWAPAK